MKSLSALRPVLSCCLAAILISCAAAWPLVAGASDESYAWTHFAGQMGGPGSADGAALEGAAFDSPSAVAVAADGTIYVADENNYTIRKISTSGVVSTFAGSPGKEGYVDATGTDARFFEPDGLALDSHGNLFVSDRSHVRKITPDGVVTTFLDQHASAMFITGDDTFYYVSGSSLARITRAGEFTPIASTGSVNSLAVDADGNVYVISTDRAAAKSDAIRKITPGGVVSVFAGNPGEGGHADGTGTGARFRELHDLAIDADGNLYASDEKNHNIRKVTPAGVVTTLAGPDDGPDQSGARDGPGNTARFYHPEGMAVDAAGNVVVADLTNNAIRRVTPAGMVTTIAGRLSIGSTDGPADVARFWQPQGVAVSSTGMVYVADERNDTIRRISPDGTTSTFVGVAGESGPVDGDATTARLNQPRALAIDVQENLYVVDNEGSEIRKITPEGNVTTLAGGFQHLNSLAVDAAGNIYAAEGSCIRQITPDVEVTTYAGSPWESGGRDGPAGNALFGYSNWVACDDLGNVYVSDAHNHAIRMISPARQVTTLAGKMGVEGYADGSLASARFSYPGCIAVDRQGNLLVADLGSSTIRKISRGGEVTTIGGLADVTGFVPGIGAASRFSVPGGLAVAPDGSIYATSMSHHSVMRGTVVRPQQEGPEILVERQAFIPLPAGAVLGPLDTEVGGIVSLPITIRNTGTQPLTGISLSITGTAAAEYAADNLPAGNLAPGAGMTFSIHLRPYKMGTKDAELRISSNDAIRNPFILSLTGNATETLVVAPPPAPAVHPTTGSLEHKVTVIHTGASVAGGVRLRIDGVPAGVEVVGGTYVAGGNYWLVDHGSDVLPGGGSTSATVAYRFTAGPVAFTPQITIAAVPSPGPAGPAFAQAAGKMKVYQNMTSFDVLTVPGRRYAIWYSADLVTWQRATDDGGILSRTSRLEWYDDGSRTATPPLQAARRFYRVEDVTE